MFVSWKERPEFGVGRLIGTAGTIGTVEYFDTPTNVQRPCFDAPMNQLQQCRLGAQTRVYYYDQRSKYWEIGRVVDHVDKDVFVRFPNSRELRLQEHEVHVRWRQPLEDPTAHLATFLNETPSATP